LGSRSIVLNDADYRHSWDTTDLSALEIGVRRGTSLLAAKRAIEGIIGRDSGLRVQTRSERAAQADVLAREGLDRLTQISFLLIIAAALAMAAAMGASIWQRRPSLASLRIQSYRPSQLRIILLFESTLVLGTGCFIGVVAGVYGHELIDRYLRLVTGFPAPFSPSTPQMLETTIAIIVAALIVLSVPGYIASRVTPSLALQE
jgi:putative ABC transport system permease protein